MKQIPTQIRKRSELNPAPYNPREIAEMSLAGLRKSLKRFGLVSPIVWNIRTGYVVGGHQRLRVMDEDAKYDPVNPTTDYDVEVKTVDLSDSDERALNLALNNQHITGHWDGEKLMEMLVHEGDNVAKFIESAGFTTMSLASEFESLGMQTEVLDMLMAPEAREQQRVDVEAINEMISATDSVRPDPSSVEAIKARKELVNEQNAPSHDADYYAAIVFKDSAQKRAFFAACGVRDTTLGTYDGREIAANLSIQL